MPFVNIPEDDRRPVYKRAGKRRIIPRHVIRARARQDFLDGVPGFSCPECLISYALSFGRVAKKGLFGEQTHYCLDCIDDSPNINRV